MTLPYDLNFNLGKHPITSYGSKLETPASCIENAGSLDSIDGERIARMGKIGLIDLHMHIFQ